ncbi:DUF2523 family protein [Thiocystis violacea]|uniref:DUF2523 family protein n=1 Tax=Thiocystis violacea TaxID=13725 RepID=UPI00190356B2|nr:DUF2523 family protein [Thiocystis violacea]MBK1718525.1 hypothetical protein [Thiocystis violacea]
MTDLINFLRGLVEDFVTWALSILTAIAEWFLLFLQDIFQWLYQQVIGALAALLEALPVPDFLNSTASVFSAIPSSVIYLASVGQFPAGLSILGSAYLIRFIIRRLPVVG